MAEPLRVAERQDLTLATIMTRRGIDPAAIGDALGIGTAGGPAWSSGGGMELIGTGPGHWLAIGGTADLAERLSGIASVSDQSGAYVVLRFSGSGARTLLQRGVAIDLDPSVFAPGSAATTLIAHIGVILWQVDAAPTFDVAIFRSYATSFRQWLSLTSASLP